jgi:hypothetical protein
LLTDKFKLLEIIDRLEIGLINRDDINILRGAVQRLDEMDDLLDTVCSCRTQEIPILRDAIQRKWDDDAPGRP